MLDIKFLIFFCSIIDIALKSRELNKELDTIKLSNQVILPLIIYIFLINYLIYL